LQAPARAATQPAAPPAAEAVVKKGDPVELIAGNDLFSVSRMMVADEDGEVGQYISVREDRKSTPVSARVERAGVVRAPTI
jgi:flagella basal body P-ring formation protein FlgA